MFWPSSAIIEAAFETELFILSLFVIEVNDEKYMLWWILSFWWKFINMMKIQNCNEIWFWLKLPKGWEFMIENKDCYLLRSLWCNENIMNTYWLDKNSSMWGNYMLSYLDLRSTLHTNELCFCKVQLYLTKFYFPRWVGQNQD